MSSVMIEYWLGSRTTAWGRVDSITKNVTQAKNVTRAKNVTNQPPIKRHQPLMTPKLPHMLSLRHKLIRIDIPPFQTFNSHFSAPVPKPFINVTEVAPTKFPNFFETSSWDFVLFDSVVGEALGHGGHFYFFGWFD